MHMECLCKEPLVILITSRHDFDSEIDPWDVGSPARLSSLFFPSLLSLYLTFYHLTFFLTSSRPSHKQFCGRLSNFQAYLTSFHLSLRQVRMSRLTLNAGMQSEITSHATPIRPSLF